jgi:hypothetical protein
MRQTVAYTKKDKKMSRAQSSRCLSFGLILMSIISPQSQLATAFSPANPQQLIASRILVSPESNKSLCHMRMSKEVNNDSDNGIPRSQRSVGRKRALLQKYGKAIVLSTTLLYGPMASMPAARRILGSTAHAASTVATATAPTSGSDYNFKDFKDIKGKLSLAPGADVQQYEEILAKVEVMGEKALEDAKYESKAALTIGDSGSEGGVKSSDQQTDGRRGKKAQKQKQLSDWESVEFGFGDADDEDFDEGVISLGSGATTKKGKLSPSSKSKSGVTDSGGKGGGGDVLLTDKLAYNNYKAPLSKDEQMKTIKKGAFYSIFPVFVITMIRGRIKSYKEKKWVKKGLAIVEEERKKYLEEKKKKKEGKKPGDDDDDDGKFFVRFIIFGTTHIQYLNLQHVFFLDCADDDDDDEEEEDKKGGRRK